MKINSQHVAEILDKLRELDPVATEQLLFIKVPVNEQLRQYPDIHFYDDKLTIFGALAGLTSSNADYKNKEDLLEPVLNFFNNLATADNEALKSLILTRVSVNDKIANHPELIVLAKADSNGRPVDPKFGLLGVLNGIVGLLEDGWGRIGVEMDEDDKFYSFIDTQKWRETHS
jgi:hypothetical protein